MVTHHSKDGHPPSKIYQKEEYYRLEIWQLDLTHKIKTVKYHGWSATILRMVRSPNMPRMVTHHPKYTRRICNTDMEFGI